MPNAAKKKDRPAKKQKPGKAKPVAAGAKKLKKRTRAAATPSFLQQGESGAVVLDRLWRLVQARQGSAPARSHSARLLARGTRQVVQKLGEEMVELMIEAVAGNRAALVLESADVLYHLLVTWFDAGVTPDEIWAELQKREAASHGMNVGPVRTTKIP